MTDRRSRLAVPLAVAALLLSGSAFLAMESPAEAQCLPQTECDSLKQQLHDARHQFKGKKHEIRDLKRQARSLPRGSAERRALKDQIRDLRQETKDARKAARPLRERYRSGCKNC